MIVGRFKVRCLAQRVDEMAQALAAVVVSSRTLPGVIHFDVGRDVTDPNVFIATEVFESHAALEAQESQAEVARVMDLIGNGAVEGEPEWMVYEVE